jgi:hypothetical protein
MWGFEFTTKAATIQGIKQNSFQALVLWALAQLFPAPAFRFVRYLAVLPRSLPAAALVERRRYLNMVPRPMPAAPRRYLAVVGAQAVT